MARCLLGIMLLLTPLLAGAQIYRWVDAQGQVHYGDRPPRDAGNLESVDLGPLNSVAPAGAEGAAGASGDAATAAASRPPRVLMYSTSWCGYCAKARSYFRSKGIRYTERDIEKSERGKREYDALGGRGVPVILVGDQRLNGFSVERFERLLAQR